MSVEFEASSQAGFPKDKKPKNPGFAREILIKAAIIAPAIGFISCGSDEKDGLSPKETFTPNITPTPTRTIEPAQTPEPALEPTQAKSFTDPFEYCASTGTIDAPDNQWIGGETPNEVIDFFLQKENLDPQYWGESKFYNWRCVDGTLNGCFIGVNLPCQEANTSSVPTTETVRFCQENPDSPAPFSVTGHDNIYLWQCQGETPQIEKQIYEVDSRGFIKEYWHQIPE